MYRKILGRQHGIIVHSLVPFFVSEMDLQNGVGDVKVVS